MATQAGTKQARTTSTQKTSGQRQQGQQGQQGRQMRGSDFPLDNLSYNMVTVLYEKSKALEAFDKYLADARDDDEAAELFEQMRENDAQFVEQLCQQLGQRLTQQ